MTDLIIATVNLGVWWRWAETTTVAGTVRNSLLLTGFLSALHLVGLTLVVGGVLVSSLRRLNVLFVDKPLWDVTTGIDRGVAIGLSISVVTGVLLFLPRASAAAHNGFFQLKMALIIAAGAAYVAVRRGTRARSGLSSRRTRLGGALNLALWVCVAAAGCAYILLE